MSLIRIDYLDAIHQASKLKNAAQQCEDAERAVDKAYSEVSESWSGEAADAFKVKLEEWKAENNRIKEECIEVARLIETVAKQIQEADEAAASAISGGGGGGGGGHGI